MQNANALVKFLKNNGAQLVGRPVIEKKHVTIKLATDNEAKTAIVDVDFKEQTVNLFLFTEGRAKARTRLAVTPKKFGLILGRWNAITA
jgi:hypothetical protein